MAPTWNDPDHCPFCEAELPNPGAGFVDHIDDHPTCESGFETWRRNVADDMHGGWAK
ncbi:DUF7501 family protein [Halomicrococcus gelatinilyticus]|mgnify:FL=1|jgi:hypothetical protein|uniref:DUF7501 family protein n=1 Tax=Halomicrococcus gelatinilyticus TaxID=1702103 RepID=UPI002E148A65